MRKRTIVNICMLHSIMILILLLSPLCGTASPVTRHGLIHHQIIDKALGTIDFYVSDSLHNVSKPILLFLDGSGNRPLFFYNKDQENNWRVFSSVPFSIQQVALKYHVVLISKPGSALTDTLAATESVTPTYEKYASADWRVKSAAKVIGYVIKHYPVDVQKVAVMGYSEGGQVAPRLAVFDKRVTHCIAFAGGGLNQFFDEILRLRTLAAKGEMSAQDSQTEIDSLYKTIGSIYNDPYSTKKYWGGHTYLRWSSFTAIPTIEYFKRLSIPVYIAQGTEDNSTNILSADYIKLEFLRLKKSNLTYRVYPGYDHFFTNCHLQQNIMDDVVNEALAWLSAH